METEKRLIYADEVVELINGLESLPWEEETEDLVNSLTTVDAVEVVRCKDCKHWKCWRISGEGTGDCLLDEGYAALATQHYDFCSYGERKDNATD